MATRSDRLALSRAIFAGDAGDGGGPLEIDYLVVDELDDSGRFAESVVFDPDDLEAAYAELDARFAADPREPHARVSLGVVRAIAQRDWETVVSLCAPEFVQHDHRGLAMLGTTRGPEAWAQNFRTLVDLAPDSVYRTDHIRCAARGAVVIGTWQGTREGGSFEIPNVVVLEIGERGAIVRADIYEPDPLGEAMARFHELSVDRPPLPTQDHGGDHRTEFCDPQQLDRVLEDFDEVRRRGRSGSPAAGERNASPGSSHNALARFGELQGSSAQPLVPTSGLLASAESLETAPKDGAYSGRTDVSAPYIEGAALHIPPNAAIPTLDRVAQIFASGNTNALRELVTDDFCFDDRKKQSLVRGGVEEWIRALEFLVTEIQGRTVARLIATAGDQLALHHVRWHEDTGDARFEIENYRLTEVDNAGKLRALILFDPADRDAASDELGERYAASGADGAPAGIFDLMRAWNTHDLDRLRALLPNDFYLDDHKRTGVGRLEGADAYIASIAALYELSEDVRMDPLYSVSIAEHGRVYVARWSGTNTEGGVFESVYVVVGLLRNGRPSGMEIFEFDDLDRALARFQELRPRGEQD